MLTKYEKAILKSCNDNFDPEGSIASEDLSKFVPELSPYHLYLCCKGLDEKGYFRDFALFINGDFVFQLDYKGIHYRKISKLEFKELLFKSVAIPIGVSIITTLITIYLNGVL